MLLHNTNVNKCDLASTSCSRSIRVALDRKHTHTPTEQQETRTTGAHTTHG